MHTAQANGVTEAFEKYNKEHCTHHHCRFLPKFHPELNPIERVWSRMKWYIRQWVDGSMDTLQRLMYEGLSYPEHDRMQNLSLTTIRKYIRLSWAYLHAYDKNLDIVAAGEWLKQRRSHRGYSGQMDAVLEMLYFPNGRGDAVADGIEDEGIEDYAEADVAAALAAHMGAGADAEHEEVDESEEVVVDDYIYGEEDDDDEYENEYEDEVDLNALYFLI